jgi:hypothetical protein
VMAVLAAPKVPAHSTSWTLELMTGMLVEGMEMRVDEGRVFGDAEVMEVPRNAAGVGP